MPRLIGLSLFLWLIAVSIDYSVTHAPQPEAATAVVPAESSPIETLTEARDEAVAAGPGRPSALAWQPGVYEVLDLDRDESPIARLDRDVRPRTEVISDDTTFEASSIPSSAQDLEGQLRPGLYATSFEAEDCTYELWQVLRSREASVIAEDYLARGRLLVSINEVEPDWFSSTQGCGQWRRWEAFDQPLTRADNGDYWRGDLARGRWSAPAACRWEKVTAFRGYELADVIESGGPETPLVVDGDTWGVRIRGCRAAMTLEDPDDGAEDPAGFRR